MQQSSHLLVFDFSLNQKIVCFRRELHYCNQGLETGLEFLLYGTSGKACRLQIPSPFRFQTGLCFRASQIHFRLNKHQILNRSSPGLAQQKCFGLYLFLLNCGLGFGFVIESIHCNQDMSPTPGRAVVRPNVYAESDFRQIHTSPHEFMDMRYS